MTTAERLTTAAENMPKVYEAGKKAEYDKFWDIFQNRGERTGYEYAFSDVWTNDIFKPKYNLVPEGSVGATGMFRGAKLDISAGLAHNGVKLDFSKCTQLSSTFQSSGATNIPPIDMQSCSRTVLAFYNTTITQLYLNNLREDCTFDRTFSHNAKLVDLIITGTIGQNGFSVQQSVNLSKSSITSIINALSGNTSGLAVTLSRTAVNKAFATTEGGTDGSTSDEWEDLIATKSNWTITLA